MACHVPMVGMTTTIEVNALSGGMETRIAHYDTTHVIIIHRAGMNMNEDSLQEIIDTLLTMLDYSTEQAHKHPVPMEFEGSRTFTKEELNAVWNQGRKDALRTALVWLRDARGY